MRLKTIKLAGFKSFVDPTIVKLPSNLCGVVGPNGCGKSNIIDAVRWVLGEASAKHLRGESMADVIFNGSTGRKPVGQAAIELVFDNAEGTLGGEYASYAEIAIRRTVSRDGLSHYYLNGTRCRRRDITDIFLGTGLGPRSYAIIEQGMISRLIEARPEDLRVYIEEAAGISRYKERRKDTENRIRRTRENLERLTDFREELERQLQHLKRQAAAAERYSELKTEERRISAELLALQWRQLDAQGAGLRESVLRREVELAAIDARHARVDADIEKAREQHSGLTEALGGVQERYYAIGADIARTEQSVQLQQERARQLRADLDQTRRSREEAERHLRDDEARLARIGAELEDVVPALAGAEAAELAGQETLALAEEAMHRWQLEWDEFSSASEAPRREVGVQQSRIRHLEEALAQAQQRLERLEHEAAELDTTAVETERETLDARVQALEEISHGWQERADTVRGQIDVARGRITQLTGQLDEVRGALQEQRGRFASLQALQQAALGQTDEVVTGWLQAQGIARNQRVAERLAVDAGWETAVETVLGNHLQAVCVDDMNPLAAALEHFGAGALGLFSPRLTAAGAGAAPRSLAARVRAEFDVGGLLAGVLVADSLPEALALQRQLAPGESVVTRDGIWLGRDWLRLARDTDARAGVIQRSRELAALGAATEAGREREALLLETLEQSREELRELEAGMLQQQQELRAATARYTEARSALSGCTARLEQMLLRDERNRSEQQQTRERRDAQRAELQAARSLLEAALDAMHRDSQQRETLQLQRDMARQALEAARQKARQDKDSAHQLAMRRQSLGSQTESLRAAIARIAGQFAQLEARAEALAAQIGATEGPIAEGRELLETQLQDRLAVEGELTAARARVQQVEHELREAERSRHAIEQEAGIVRAALEQERIAAQGVQVRLGTILEQLQKGHADLGSVMASLPDDAGETAWQAQLERLGNQLARLGPINLAAIEEHRQQSERKNYLDAQNADLVEALETLENAIRKIDRETRTRFKDTFDRVNSGLQELFPRVFGGGHAYLELTGEDLLDTGVAIMARPPGKRNATIHLLSGGEKALTAISLVFSIFRLNPSPFCMLDEVDAPLDDANVGRFARLVKEMSETVQFIVITHNKITMEMTHHLMGVTMQEPGVSRLVSVDVEEAVALAHTA
jgi:chromosome segregation protein